MNSKYFYCFALRWLAYVIAGVFAIAATSKMLLLLGQPFSGSISPLWLVAGIAMVEMVFTWQLLTRGLNSSVVLISVTLFSASLLITSLYYFLMGVTNCECFGVIKVPQWVTLGWNIAATSALLLIAYFRPRASYRCTFSESAEVLTCLVLGFLLGCSMTIPTVSEALGFAIPVPREISVELEPVDALRRAAPNSQLVYAVKVNNRSDRAVRIVGGGSNCGCVTLQSLPIEVAAQASVNLTVEVATATEIGHYERRVVYYLDGQSDFYLAFNLSYEVVAE